MRRFTILIMATMIMLVTVYAPPAGALVIYDFAGYLSTPNEHPPDVNGVLMLEDTYTPGTDVAHDDFVSFSYSSLSGSYLRYKTDLNGDPDDFQGALPAVAGTAYVSINFMYDQTYFYTFLTNAQWGTEENDDGTSVHFLNSGPSHVWTLRESAPPVPEPATILLVGTGLAGFAGIRIRKRFKK